MKYVYAFSEGNKDMRELLGGKGANLAEMTRIGLPVPRGFTVTTEACLKYYKDNEEISDDIKEEIFKEFLNTYNINRSETIVKSERFYRALESERGE